MSCLHVATMHFGELGSDLFSWLTVTHSSRESTGSGQGAGWSWWKVSHCSSCLCCIWLMNKGLVFYPGFQLNFGKHRHLPKCLNQFIWLLNEWLFSLEQNQNLKLYSEKISNDQWMMEICLCFWSLQCQQSKYSKLKTQHPRYYKTSKFVVLFFLQPRFFLRIRTEGRECFH